VEHSPDGHRTRHEADHFLSTMPVQDLVAGLQPAAPHDIQSIAAGLQYRDFITVGLLCRRLKIRNHGPVRTVNDVIPDLWIYVQERDVRIGRFQIFNNWSPYLAADPSTTWLGLEYFCTQGDDLWRMPKDDFRAFAIGELAHLGILDPADVLDGTVIKVKKTYPAYFGSYDDFPRIREYLDGFENLFLIGRNGMHKYNNQDHSMLTAMTAVENIRAGRRTKDNIWAVNTEEEYHEEKRDVRRSAS
jgi:protoporphyrinogen oxidase